MATTSLTFGLFVAVVLGIYYALPRARQNGWLLLVSYLFCITWSWQFAIILALATAANYWLLGQISRREDKASWMWAGILTNIIVLLFFKRADFFLPELVARLAGVGVETSDGLLTYIVPIGISYYVLEAISTLVDMQKGRLKVLPSALNYALYLAYFPKLIAGPIERARIFVPKLEASRTVDNATLSRAVTLLLIGLVRKLVIADTLRAAMPAALFSDPASLAAPALLLWLFAILFWVYNDFAGYTQIARGVSLFFGIELSPNFQQPLFARNLSEMWGSWHMSLSLWLRDYLFFPFGRFLLGRFPNRRHIVNFALPPLLTMTVSGLWHDISSGMLLWGILQGIVQVVERVPSLWRPVVPPRKWPRWRQIVGTLSVMLVFIMTGMPFVLGVDGAIHVWRTFITPDAYQISMGTVVLALNLSLFVGATCAIDWLQLKHPQATGFLHFPSRVRVTLLVSVFFALLMVLQATQAPPFIYQGF